MELITKRANNHIVRSRQSFISEAEVVEDNSVVSTSKPFIEANTVETSLEEITRKHIIPVFLKDNETVISHVDFIETTNAVAREIFHGEKILRPNIRVSHPIKGRTPEARNKAANELLEHEKTLYYERMAFVIEIPSIHDQIDGNTLSLCVGGVKAYNLDNLYNKKGADEHFKIFIGFQNRVCTNLCVWTDGFYSDLKVNSRDYLRACIKTVIENYNASFHLHQMAQLSTCTLTEHQFAHFIGKCRMYPHLPKAIQNEISPLLFGDTQLGVVCRDYYKDNSFCRDDQGNINLWRLYNLFTGANKSTYIDNFLDRSVHAFQFIEKLRAGMQEKGSNWFLN